MYKSSESLLVLGCILLFLVCFVSAALVAQLLSDVPPSSDNSPLDYFTGGALWIASSTCLIIAITYVRLPLKLCFWLTGCAALSVLAIDEFIAIHERTDIIVGDDDHSKVFLWGCTPIALILIGVAERIRRPIIVAFVIGFLLHTIYLISDLGDGDYFTLPVPLEHLRWTEDICELLFVCSYLSGLLLIVSSKLRNH